MLQASEIQQGLLKKYRWNFSPEWFVPEYSAIVAAMGSPGNGSKGTSEKRRRSRSTETGREETAVLVTPQISPLGPQPPPLLTRGPPEADTPAPEEEFCSPTSSKKKKKKGRKEDASQGQEEEAGGETEEEKKEDVKMDITSKDPAEITAKGPEKSKKRAKSQSLLKTVKVPVNLCGGTVPGKPKGKKVKVREIPIGTPHQPAPGDPNGGTGAEGRQEVDVDEFDDLPLSARCSLPSGQRGPKRLKRKKAGKAGKDKPGEQVIRRPARLGGIYKRLLKKSSRGARPAEWLPEPPLSDPPNLALTKETEMALLDTLRGRAQLLDDLGSPLPVARLLGSLCSSSFGGAATTITMMVEKLTRGIMREGPVWGLPREAVYTVTHQQPRPLPPSSTEEGAASSKKPRKGNYWRRGGRKRGQKDNPKGTGSEEKGSGKPAKVRKPPRNLPPPSRRT